MRRVKAGGGVRRVKLGVSYLAQPDSRPQHGQSPADNGERLEWRHAIY